MQSRVGSRVVFSVLASLLLAVLAACGSVTVGQHPAKSTVKIGAKSTEVNYLLYIPETYVKDRKARWPIILFLHGMGECGTNLDLLKKHPLPQMLETRKDFPFIVVSPRLQDPNSGFEPLLEPMEALLQQIQSRFRVDLKRVYVTGLSMGGSGAWKMALRFPHRFAAAVPVAGFWDWGNRDLPKNLCDLRGSPHLGIPRRAGLRGAPFGRTRSSCDALKTCGSSVRFTVYDDTGHEDTWRRAYADPALFEWMLAQTVE